MKKTLFDKVWDAHVVDTVQDGPQVLYIDKHLIHEVTSPQAFNELVDRNIPIYRPDQIVATADHNTPTSRPTFTCQRRIVKEGNSHNFLKTVTKIILPFMN